MILLDVDHLILACPSSDLQGFHASISQRFKLGKYEVGSSDFCGRRITLSKEGVIEVDMQKYIMEDLHEIPLSRQRRSEKKEQVTMEEFTSLRSAIFRINWLGRETRPEVCGTASILASRLGQAKVEDITNLNAVIRYLKKTSDRTLKVWPIPMSELHLMSFSDAGGVLAKDSGEWVEGKVQEPTQGAWLIFSGRLDGKDKVRSMTPLMWRSGKLKRKVPSTLAGETLALGEAVASVEWLQIFLADFLGNQVCRKDWVKSLSPFSVTLSSSGCLKG